MKILILDDWYENLKSLPSFQALQGHDVTISTVALTDPADLANHLNFADAVILFRDRTKITADVAARLNGPKLIAMRGQHNHVDVSALTQAGVLFCSRMTKDGPSVPTAELAFGQIIAALRYLPDQVTSARAGHWQGAAPLGRNVAGKVLGLYGYGGIAQTVARFADAFAMPVVVWASDAGRARAVADGRAVAESRAAFFRDCDVISLHKRLTADTRGEVTRADMMAMKPDSVLVNTARSGLIEDGAILAALSAGRIGRAALDVFDSEPAHAADDLISHERVIPTPHVGFVTAEELDKQFGEIYSVVTAYAAGAPTDMINPEVWATQTAGQ